MGWVRRIVRFEEGDKNIKLDLYLLRVLRPSKSKLRGSVWKRVAEETKHVLSIGAAP